MNNYISPTAGRYEKKSSLQLAKNILHKSRSKNDNLFSPSFNKGHAIHNKGKPYLDSVRAHYNDLYSLKFRKNEIERRNLESKYFEES